MSTSFNLDLMVNFFFVNFFIVFFVYLQRVESSDPLKPLRVPNSPFPASYIPRKVYAVDLTNSNQDMKLLMQSFAGILAHSTTNNVESAYLYLTFNGIDLNWLKQLSILTNISIVYTTPEKAVQLFKNLPKGYILFNNSTISVAVSFSGISSGILVTNSTLYLAIQNNIPFLQDVTSWTLPSLYNNITYKNLFNDRILMHQSASTEFYEFLADYAIFSKSFTIGDILLSTHFGEQVLSNMKPYSSVIGWGSSEHNIVKTASKESAFVNCADYFTNLAVMSNMDNRPSIFNRISPATFPETENVHYVTFIMTDGDNIQWLENAFNFTQWYGSPLRGQFPVGWTISPSVFELTPLIATSIINTATKNDDFVGGASGLGYSYPSYIKNVAGYAELTREYLKVGNMSTLNIIDDNLKANVLKSFLEKDGIDGIFFYNYQDYVGIQGKIIWADSHNDKELNITNIKNSNNNQNNNSEKNKKSNQKPITGGRYILSTSMGHHSVTPDQLIPKLNSASTNVYSADAWDVVPVHVWTMNMTDVKKVIDGLNPSVKVVSPSEYIRLMRYFHPI